MIQIGYLPIRKTLEMWSPTSDMKTVNEKKSTKKTVVTFVIVATTTNSVRLIIL